MKRIIYFVLACIFSLGNVSANVILPSIRSFTVNVNGIDIRFTIVNHSTREVNVGDLIRPIGVSAISKSTEGEIDIPSIITYNNVDYTVTGICNHAFDGCAGLTNVTIPEDVTSIGNQAFSGCTSLTSINIPSSMTSIGSDAFNYCTSLTKVTINSNEILNSNDVKSIFGTQVEEYIIGEGVTSIGSHAFDGCTSMKSVTISEGVTSIGKSAFYGCTGLTSITIPSSMTSIGSDAFSGCTSLTNVTINSNEILNSKKVTSIFGTQVEEYIIGEGVTTIGSDAFSGCTGLTSVNIPSSVTSIGDWAFYDCTGLTSVNIPSSVTSIGDRAFYDCTGLTSVTIPEGVTSIGSSTFNSCTGLTSVNIPSSVTSIGNYAFYKCTGLTSVNIPSSVTSIGEAAFYGCTGLTSVTISSSVNNIEKSTFYGCIGLRSITLPNSIETIGANAFYGCKELAEIDIPESVKSIETGAFIETDIRSVSLPDDVNVYPKIGSTPGAFSQETVFYIRKGSNTLLRFWDYLFDSYYYSTYAYKNFYEKGTGNELPMPTVSLIGTTQKTATLQLENRYEEYKFYYFDRNNDSYLPIAIDNIIRLSDLSAEKEYTIYIGVGSGEESLLFTFYKKFTTAPISLAIKIISRTASSIRLKGTYIKDDVDVASIGMKIGKTYSDDDTIELTGLDPETYNDVIFYVNESDNSYYSVRGTFSTLPLTLTTQAPKVISSGNVIVAAEANVDDEEENVGFEWRRTDWTDDFPSNTGIAYLYEGTMEGYIRNMNTDKLWKVRPYYLSDSGTYYYGDWMGLDPTNTSYFEPTVHTYDKIEVEGNTALVKGYALNGTDKIAVQGFKYWKDASKANSGSMAAAKAPTVPAGAMTVEAEGRIMETTISGLDYETNYNYVAFVKTTEGETFYGDVRSFTTGVNTSGIDNTASSDTSLQVVGIYDLQGHRQEAMRPGINIIRYSDGSARKVMIRR